MATINSFIRSYGAAVRRAERTQQRKNREAAKRFKEQQKQVEFQNVANAVRDWNEYVYILKSIHKEASEKVDWIAIKNEPKPKEPEYSTLNATIAIRELNSFKPSFVDKMFGLTNQKIKKLKNKIDLATKNDKKKYQDLLDEYHQFLTSWEALQRIAHGIEQQNVEAYLEAIQYFDPFSEISELGSQIKFTIEQNYIEVDININSIDIIPDFELKQTSTGKLSRKNMSKTNFYELYQDHVCSVVLRISREIFAYVPVSYAIINAKCEMIDTQSGHLENKIILSVKVVPETIEKLNLSQIDPSDSMSNFIHNMNFKKTSGFQEVTKVE